MSPVERLTAPGAGGVAVLAVRGAQSSARLAELLDGDLPRPGRLVLRRLQSGAQGLDEALLHGIGPEQYELHLHASPPLVREVMELLGTAREQSAPDPSLEARAARALQTAPCDGAARMLLDQAGGALKRTLLELLEESGSRSATLLANLVARGEHAARALQPATVVLAGPVNAGKSTLFNVLVGEGRVVVSPEEGTTRDLIRMRALLGDWPLDLVDSAGERDLAGQRPAELVELEGQRLGREVRRTADLVLWLTPVDQASSDPGAAARLADCSPTPVVPVATCADRLSDRKSTWPAGSLSALADPEHARGCVMALLGSQLGLQGTIWTPGLAVPFEPWQLALARQAVATPDPSHRAGLLEAWIAGDELFVEEPGALGR